MDKKNENPKTQAVIFFFTTAVISFILWPLLDLFWRTVITHSPFNYTFQDYILEPLIFTAVITLVFYVPPIIKARKSSKK